MAMPEMLQAWSDNHSPIGVIRPESISYFLLTTAWRIFPLARGGNGRMRILEFAQK
jgi:hypothetical protein